MFKSGGAFVTDGDAPMSNVFLRQYTNFAPKTLHVAVSRLDAIVSEQQCENGLIYDPAFDRAHPGAVHQYNLFFYRAHEVEIIAVETEQGPGEYATTLGGEYEVTCRTWIGGMTAPIHIPPGNVERLIADLRAAPRKYFTSPEKTCAPNR
jgi:hypothetical protein